MPLGALGSALSLALGPGLPPLARGLDDQPLCQAGKADVAPRHPWPPLDGRPSSPVALILRLLVVKPRDGWSAAAPARGQRSPGVAPVPAETPLGREANLLQPAPLPPGLAPVVGLARSLQLTPGRQRRIDGTGVRPTSRPPSDRPGLHAGMRVPSRRWANARLGRQATPCPGAPCLAGAPASCQAPEETEPGGGAAARYRGGRPAADRVSTPARHHAGDRAAGPAGGHRAPGPGAPGGPATGGHRGSRRPGGLVGGQADNPAGAPGCQGEPKIGSPVILMKGAGGL
jgi:hypothetical protein